MHAITSITSRIAIGGAGRRQKHLAQIAQDTGMPVASQSLVQNPDTGVSQWTACITRIAKKMLSKKEVQPSAETERAKKLLRDAVRLVAYYEDNEKARLELKESVVAVCASEDFDKLFPPSLRYVSMAWDEEYEEALAGRASARK